ncbi:MAG: hypothetical protein ACR2K5_04900 [Pseudolabrys sp.]
MADRRSLGVIGYILGGVTAAVMLIGVTVVNASLANPSQMTQQIYGTVATR